MKFAQVKLTSGTLASTAGVGAVAWANAANAAASDNAYATSALTDTQQTVWLTALNWSFNIPEHATIRGIVVSIEKSMTEVEGASIADTVVKLWNNAAVGDSKAKTTPWTITDTNYVYGDNDDLWGYSWTPALINATTFGVAISCTATGDLTAQIDDVHITVWYDDLDGNNPGTTANIAGAGTDWADANNSQVSDNVYATAALNNSTSDPLRCTNFGFSIPTAAQITGVTVWIEKKSSGTLTLDNSVQLVYAAAAIGTDLSAGATWPTTEATSTHGGSNQMWGYALTPAIINASTFGVQIKASSTAARTASIDHVCMRIDYILGHNH